MKPINVINKLNEYSYSDDDYTDYDFLIDQGSPEAAAKAIVDYSNKIKSKYNTTVSDHEFIDECTGGCIYVYLNKDEGPRITVCFDKTGKKCKMVFDETITQDFINCLNYLVSILPVDLG